MVKRLLSLLCLFVLCFNQAALAQAPSYSGQTQIIGGNGFDSVQNLTGTATGPRFLNASKLTIASGAVISFLAGTIWQSQRPVSIVGTVTTAHDMPSQGGTGHGTTHMYFDSATNTLYGLGSGGAGWGRGDGNGAGGGHAGSLNIIEGSSGANGFPANNIMNSAGGSGGGKITIVAQGALTIQNTGVINGNGGNGTNSSNGPGGGGGGGATVALYSTVQVVNLGSISVVGGNGGTKFGTGQDAKGGGGGGGGLVFMMSPTAPTAGTCNVSGGNSAPSGPPLNGDAGIVITITDMPSYPLVCLDDKHRPELIAAAKRNHGRLNLSKEEHRTLLASFEAIANHTTLETELARVWSIGSVCADTF